MTDIALDAPRIYELCTEQGISINDLAGCLGTTSPTRLTRLLIGEGAHVITLREVTRLGQHLGVDPLSLLTSQEPRRQASEPDLADAVRVQAVLSLQQNHVIHQDIARVLGWDLRRTAKAVRALEEMVRDTGQRLHCKPGKGAKLVSRDTALSDEARQRAKQIHLHRTGLNARQASRLLGLVEYGAEKSPRDNRSILEIGALVNRGLALRACSGDVAVAPAVLYSLGLED